MTSPFSHTPLGRTSALPMQYAPQLLAAVPRALSRAPHPSFAFDGFDLWQLYEISWRDARGVPQMGEGRLRVPCHSPCVVESKSLKLYLIGLNEHAFDSPQACAATIEADVSACVGAPVSFVWGTLTPGSTGAGSVCLEQAIGASELAVHLSLPQARAALSADATAAWHEERLHTHVFRSLCPVTGQPDWASLFFRYEGAPIDVPALLAYLIAFRAHGAMHEHCIEQIFADIMGACRPRKLCVDARFLRRGGIDINPLRSNAWQVPLAPRLGRQ